MHWIILDDILLVPWHKEKYNQSVFHLFFTFDCNCFSCAPCSQLRSFLPPHFVIVKHRGFSLQCGSVYFFLLQRLLSALSAKLGEEEGEELGQQPWACHWFTAFEWFSPLPHVCVVFPLSVSALPLCLPFALPLCFDLSSSLYPHNLFCCVNLCSVLLYSALYLFLFSHFYTCECCPIFVAYTCWVVTVSIRLYSQKYTLISGCI